jgi:O-antigen/teichoic acid export membrane protein
MESYRLAAKLLFIIAWPITIGTMILAPDLIRVLAGEAFLPDSANALRILIWFAPISYVNGITQYVLIAVNRQRTITIAFAVGVTFNFVANLLLVPIYGYIAAAGVTVATEAVLFVPLAIAVKRYVGEFNWLAFAVRPSLAAVAMGAAELATRRFDVLPALFTGVIVYFAVLVLSGAIGHRETEIARMLFGRSKPAVPQS